MRDLLIVFLYTSAARMTPLYPDAAINFDGKFACALWSCGSHIDTPAPRRGEPHLGLNVIPCDAQRVRECELRGSHLLRLGVHPISRIVP